MSKNTKTILIIAGLLIVACVGYYFYNKSKKDKANESIKVVNSKAVDSKVLESEPKKQVVLPPPDLRGHTSIVKNPFSSLEDLL